MHGRNGIAFIHQLQNDSLLEGIHTEVQEAFSVQAERSGAPVIAGFSPISGLPGTRVTISGSHFGVEGPADLSVLFSATEAILVSVSATSIVAIVPAGATTGTLRVTTPTGTAVSTSPFTVMTPVPKINSFSPLSGRPGDLLSITGTGLVEIDIVKFNGVYPPLISPSDTSITVLVPTGATTGRIQLFSATRPW